MTRTVHAVPPVQIKNWIRANLAECTACLTAIDRGLPFADERFDWEALSNIQAAMRSLVEESQMIGLRRSQVVKAG